jgi:hypothetical protein
MKFKKILERQTSEVTQEIENLNGTITSNEIELIINIVPTKKGPCLVGLLVNSSTHLKNNNHQSFTLFH